MYQFLGLNDKFPMKLVAGYRIDRFSIHGVSFFIPIVY